MSASYEVDGVTYHGTIAVLFAHDGAGHEVAIAAEPDMARDVDTALAFGRRPIIEVEPWQVLYGEPLEVAR